MTDEDHSEVEQEKTDFPHHQISAQHKDMNTPSESEMESMNDDLDEFSQDYEESKHEDEDTEYEDDLIESNRRRA